MVQNLFPVGEQVLDVDMMINLENVEFGKFLKTVAKNVVGSELLLNFRSKTIYDTPTTHSRITKLYIRRNSYDNNIFTINSYNIKPTRY